VIFASEVPDFLRFSIRRSSDIVQGTRLEGTFFGAESSFLYFNLAFYRQGGEVKREEVVLIKHGNHWEVVLGLALSVPAGAEQFLVEHFNYANGADLNGQVAGQGAWETDGTNYMVLNDDGLGDGGTSSLQYPGMTDSQGGRLIPAGDCDYILTTPVVGEGNVVYLSVLLKPTGILSGYFTMFATYGSVQGALGRLRGRDSGGQTELGVSIRGSGSAGWSGKTVALGETALVVIKFTMVPGADNDTMELWVNPTVGMPEPPADAKSLPDPGNDVNPETGILGFRFRATGAGETKEVDEIRFGTTWDDVAGSVSAEAASAPSPGDEMTDVPRDVVLNWTPGEFANTHDVYFGESLEDVNTATTASGEYKGSQTETTYALDRLDFGTTYYWRVDEVNGPPDYTVYPSEVWQFTVEPFAYPIENIIVTASSQFNENTGPEKTINGSGLDDNDLHSTEDEDIWLSSMTGPQPTWIQYEFDRVYKLHQMWVWNFNQVIEPLVGLGFKDVTIEYSTNGADWTVLADVPGFARAPGQDGYAHNTTVDFGGVPAKYIRLTANSNWGGLPQYGLSEVRFFYIPVVAREPNPASGTTNMDVDNVTLSWRAGREAALHDVYISTDQQAVIDETISPVSIPADRSYTNYDTGELELAKSYYWKVNEVNEAETPTTWQGDVWNFGTQEHLVVDDFEDYNDFEPDRIFDTWVDGWSDPTKGGSQVGYDVAPFAEQTIVHGGSQSMPLIYDNTTAGFSEATANIANLKVGNDWTKYGIKALSLWFYGDPNNVAQQMYVRLNNTKVVYEGNAINNIARPAWQLWPIDLATVSGLQNVTSLTIGVEDASTAGLLYIDDIRLHPETFAAISVDVTTPGDIVIGVPNDDDWPTDEAPEYVIDDASSTKYLHFKGPTGTTGFQVTPSVGAKVVTGLSFTTANDHAERDPIAYELSGSNAGIDGPYTVIATGDIVDFSQATEWPRFTANETQIEFDNTVAYAHYQLIFTALRDAGAANSMQIAEVELLTTIPTP